VEQNHKAGQNQPRVVVPTEEEEEEARWIAWMGVWIVREECVLFFKLKILFIALIYNA